LTRRAKAFLSIELESPWIEAQREVSSPEAMAEGVLRSDHNHIRTVVAIGTNGPGGTPLPFTRGTSLRYSPLRWENKKHPNCPGSVDQSVGHKPQEITPGGSN